MHTQSMPSPPCYLPVGTLHLSCMHVPWSCRDHILDCLRVTLDCLRVHGNWICMMTLLLSTAKETWLHARPRLLPPLMPHDHRLPNIPPHLLSLSLTQKTHCPHNNSNGVLMRCSHPMKCVVLPHRLAQQLAHPAHLGNPLPQPAIARRAASA